MEDQIENCAAVGIITPIVKPVYEDLLQPSTREIGQTVGKTVRVALAPLRLFNWGCEKMENFFIKVAEKLKNTPPENIVTPALNIAGPLFEGLKYAVDEDDLFNYTLIF